MSDLVMFHLAFLLLLGCFPVLFISLRTPSLLRALSLRRLLIVTALLLSSAVLFHLAHANLLALLAFLFAAFYGGIAILLHRITRRARRQAPEGGPSKESEDPAPRP